MSSKSSVVRKSFSGMLVIATIAVSIGLVWTRFFGMMSMQGGPPSTEPAPSAPGTEAAFTYLSHQTSNGCGLTPDAVMAMNQTMRLQGSCCSAMEVQSYRRQAAGLAKGAHVSVILHDPYDVP